MKLQSIKPEYLIGGAALVAIVYLWARGPAGAGRDVGGAVVDAASGVAGGIIEGIGGLFGVPATDPGKCAQAKAQGSAFGIATYCPAADAVGGILRGAGDLTAGAVEGIGGLFGVPKTNMTECERAKAEGRTLDASFACPAGDFLSYLWS